LREKRFIKPSAEALTQSCFYSLQSAVPAQSVIGGNARTAGALRSHREGAFRKAAFFFLWLLIFVIPWENAILIPGFGTLSRAVGIPAFGMALLAILESGTLRTLSMQHLIVLFFTMWAGLTYFWSFAPSDTVAAIFTFAQIFTMLWLIWEFAQTSEQQILLLRAYMLGAMISSVATLENFFTTTSVYGGRYTGLNFNPGDLAFIEALSIPISLYLAVRERKKILLWLDGSATVLAFCAIILTAARGALIACVPAALMFPFLFPKVKLGRNLALLIFVALAGIGSWLFMPASSWSRLSTIGSEVSSGTLNERTLIWQIGWQVFGQAPFQGVGAAAYAPTVEHALGLASDSGNNDSGVAVARLVAHNTFFSVLVEEGAIGFALFLALLLTLVLSAWKLPHVDRVFWLFLLLTWAIGACDLTWETRKPTWFVFGLLIAAASTRVASEVRSSSPQHMGGLRAEINPQTSSLPAESYRFQGTL
jgi:O-antigen ligase